MSDAIHSCELSRIEFCVLLESGYGSLRVLASLGASRVVCCSNFSQYMRAKILVRWTSILLSLPDAQSLSFVHSCEVESAVYELRYIDNELVPVDEFAGLSSWWNSSHSTPLDLANGTTVQARYCDCPLQSRRHPPRPAVFCPLIVSHCAIPSDRSDLQLYCVNQANTSVVLLRYGQYALVAWILCTFGWLFCAESGRNVFRGVLATYRTSYNDSLAARLEETNLPLAQHMIRRNLHIQRRRMENSTSVQELQELTAESQAVTRLSIGRQVSIISATRLNEKNRVPTFLRLKFHTYEKRKPKQTTSLPLDLLVNSGDPTEGNEECTICYQEVEDGQRVSDLHCGHTFHVSCLKEWCACRNVCPLCKAADICEPVYDEEMREDTQEELNGD